MKYTLAPKPSPLKLCVRGVFLALVSPVLALFFTVYFLHAVVCWAFDLEPDDGVGA